MQCGSNCEQRGTVVGNQNNNFAECFHNSFGKEFFGSDNLRQFSENVGTLREVMK